MGRFAASRSAGAAALLTAAALLLAPTRAAARRPRVPAALDLRTLRAQVNKDIRTKKYEHARALLRPHLDATPPQDRAEVLLLALSVESRDGKAPAARRIALWVLGLATAEPPAGSLRRLAARVRRVDGGLAEVRSAVEGITRGPALIRQAGRWPLVPAADAVLQPTVEALEQARDLAGEAQLEEQQAELAVALGLARSHGGDAQGLKDLNGAVAWLDRQPPPANAGRRAQWTRHQARAHLMLWRAHPDQRRLLRTMLKLAHQADVGESEPQKRVPPYTRSAQTRAFCEVVDQVEGAGACARHERAAGVAPSFYDFSRERSQAVLSDATVHQVQAEYGALLSSCARRMAMEDPMVTGVQLELLWVVQPSGRADGLEMTPRRLRGHPLEACLRQALETFRYPKYRSNERRVVVMGLAVGE